ncbi:uncharacterized protein LOC113209663 isoform X3 [Frankliniella occidentalis]|uniref:Uncharacterized protein LOC113209663 isoform X3 n=1 Tax=Frankliniella occidentalis TaxID=133901 RepID=A0A6J1SPB4_FRAOC|nr:uncharacterized protein LOC113209663 isoform X3 [Frankliniella occidentalis]
MQNIGDNNVEIPSTFEGMELMRYPDELLLLILEKVRRVDLFACRLVCRRLGALALHPGVWRHRRLVVNRRRLTCPVLRLAPCLAKLVVTVPTSSNCHPLTLLSTKCAASSLQLIVGPGGAAQGALVIRNQEALGQLRSLEVELEDDFENEVDMSGHEAAVILGAVASTGGLRDLVVNPIPECAPSPLVIECFIRNNEVSAPLLKRLHFNVCLRTQSLLKHVVAVNNATLTAINLTGFESMTAVTEMVALAPVLATLAALRELACPLLPGLEAVAACEALEKVDLQLSPGTPAATRSAVQFFLRAKALRHVAMECGDLNTPHSVCCELFEALSAGRTRATLQSVSVSFLPWTLPMPAVVQRAMLAALPLLPALGTIKVGGAVPDELLRQAGHGPGRAGVPDAGVLGVPSMCS